MALSSSKSFTDGTRGIGGRKLAMDILPEDKMAFRLMLESSQGYGMTGVREWLKNRFGTPPDLIQALNESQEEKLPAAVHKKAITPHSIPEFVIPATGKTALQISLSLGDMDLENNNYLCGSIRNRYASLKVQNTNSFDSLRIRHKISMSPKNDERKTLHRKSDAISRVLMMDSANEESGSESGTNDDPKSAAAVSLPHLRTCTSYGFTTLTESPHTRRRESLLFGTASLEEAKNLLHSRMKLPAVEDPISSPTSPRCQQAPLMNTLSLPITMSPSASTSSLQSDLSVSPMSSPLFSYSLLNQASGKKYKRRRSSSQTPPVSNAHSVSSNDLSTTTMQTRDEAQVFAPLGEIKLSLLYNRKNSTLRLSIIKTENLAKTVTDRYNLKLFIKVCLLPNKSHRQVSKVIRGTHNPCFNQQFTFKDVKPHCLQSKHLRLRICNQSSTRKYQTLGEVMLPFTTLGLKQEEEVRMWRNVEPKSTNQQFGSLKLSAIFEPSNDKLTVTVIEANSLPKHTLTGPPDSYAAVIVRQDGKSATKKQTKVFKSSTQPVFGEELTFAVSPKVETLRYTTVTVVLLSKERIRSDSVIGQVVLGHGSSTGDEQMHWSQILNQTDTAIEHCHQLQPAGQLNLNV